MQDALERHRAFPLVAIARHFFPGERAAHLAAREFYDVVGAGALADIGADGGKARIAIAQQRQQPFRPDQHFVDHARRGMEFAGKACVSFARARGAHRNVERERQNFHVVGFGALDQFKTDLVIVRRETIKLEPKYVGRDLGDFLYCCAAGNAERVGHARGLGRFRHQQIGTRPYDRRPAHRRDADRRRITRAEQFAVDRRQRRHHAVFRHDLDGVEGRPVVGDADIVAGAGVAIFIGKQRHVFRRVLAHPCRGRKSPVIFDCFQTMTIPRGRGRFCRHVVHGTFAPNSIVSPVIPRLSRLRPVRNG